MHVLTVLAIIIFAGYALYARISTSYNNQGQVIGENAENLEASPSGIPAKSPMPTPIISPPKSTISPAAKSESAKIDINVDANLTNTPVASEKIVYPGASSRGGNNYETADAGDRVYDWYKKELSSRSYQIRTNVKTQANEKFKAILQGVAHNNALKVTIDQENTDTTTRIVLE